MTDPYRDDFDALSARHASLAEELSAVRSRTRELGELKEKEGHLAQEVDALRQRLDGIATRRSLPLLDDVRVASPCTASWDAMTGDDRVRFCGSCEKDVFNLSGMLREDAERLLRERSDEICVRLYRRDDGTVLTADCPVGARRKRRKRIAVAAVGGGLMAAGSLLYASQATMGARGPMMGEVATMGTTAVPAPSAAPCDTMPIMGGIGPEDGDAPQTKAPPKTPKVPAAPPAGMRMGKRAR